MKYRLKTSALRGMLAGAALVLLPSLHTGEDMVWRQPAALAQPASAEESAFAAAKELGTAAAWEAFLKTYPQGFHADLARAYLKKLAEPAMAPAVAPPAAAEPSGPAQELPCKDARGMRSQRSDQAVTIRFVNESGVTLVLQWIDFEGALKEYGELKPGAEFTQPTYITHPWIAAYQEGSCRQLFLPKEGLSVARLLPEGQLPKADAARPPKDDHGKKSVMPSKAEIERRAKAACVDIGMIYLDGKCAPKTKAERKKAQDNKKKACPAGTYRNPYGQCQPNETGG